MGVTEPHARQILENAFPGRSPAWYQAVQAIARHEGGYGNAWKNEDVVYPDGRTFINRGAGSNNWGAIQCGHATTPGGNCGPGCFPNLDKHADGSPYQGCFKWYDSPEDGAAGFVFVLTDNGPKRNRSSVAAVLDAPDGNGNLSADDIAGAMHATGYMEASVDSYATAIVRNATALAQQLGEPLRVFRRGTIPTAPPPALTSSSNLLPLAIAFGLAIAAAKYGVG